MMVNITGAEASSHWDHKFEKQPVCACVNQFTIVKAKRHQEGKAMKGDRRPSIGLLTSIKKLHNYALIPRDGTRRVDEGSAYQVRKYRLQIVHCRKGTARRTSLLQGQNIHGFGNTQAFTAGKGRLWRQEGVAEQDLK
ncbi:Uncharacterised protein [uncultured archaeon]|nr:Uncharacterised protein [uncultured archaeon]